LIIVAARPLGFLGDAVPLRARASFGATRRSAAGTQAGQ
jgi:hypothetical protein